MYHVTHLIVNALNEDAGPVAPPKVHRARRRRSWLGRARRALGAPRYRYPLSAP
jgi:hypothetical protein